MIQPNSLPVKIFLTSEQWTPQEKTGPMKLTTFGELSHDANQGSWTISYAESEATGMAGTRTFLSLNQDGSVRLKREGSVQMDMLFSQGGHYMTQMETEYGLFDLSIMTNEVDGTLSSEGGRLSLGYSLNFSFRDAVSTRLNLVVEPEKA